MIQFLPFEVRNPKNAKLFNKSSIIRWKEKRPAEVKYFICNVSEILISNKIYKKLSKIQKKHIKG